MLDSRSRERIKRRMNLYSRPKRTGPRLDRRNAIKNIDYDASTSSSSFDTQSTHRTRSLDISSLSDRTSFRIGGTDGELDLIFSTLGLSPEDFAIPTAAWEAHKSYSPTGGSLPHSSRLRHSPLGSTRESPESDFSVSFESKVSFTDDDDVKSDGECSRSAEVGEARVLATNGIAIRDDVRLCGIDENRLGNDCSETSNGVDLLKSQRARVLEDGGDGDTDKTRERRHPVFENGIKGPRPPLLAPPPPMSRAIVDTMDSNWDLIRSFAPGDNEDSGSDEPDRAITNVDANRTTTSRIDTTGSNTLDDENEGYSSAPAELEYSLSSNGSFGSFKNWQKGDFLGSGSFGTVYEGFNEAGNFFAVKEVSLLDQGSQGKQSIFQLEQEISLLSQFHHENIVRYLGTDTDDGKLYIFLELVTKGSLAKLYQKYELRDSQVSAYTRQILSGLNYLHERKVVHRDIKCANILVDANGSVKLADFGLAKATTLNDIKSCKGTPYWMAPEVVNNSRSNNGYGLAADIWSLGCTVLEMLTRKIPYSHLEGMQALFRIGRGEPPPIPNTLSREAQDFILECLKVNPNDRPTAAQLLQHPFLKKSGSVNSVLASPRYNGVQL
ncbi:mitogen-activated protein kinase kinase kinase 1 [Lactuca sativa]|uniref:mitogen-activated protein kinase kinase kinase 1 n=1 Tax=Lactuca sativa TaxID=4236 RepID=UPI000CD887D9|nr:mitogen-activated protein kinase kinase kinase 1 [Lactuca sativa]